MTRNTRHILLIALCAISALPMCLSALFLGGRILIRKTMLEQMETETVVIRLPANGLHWYEKGHEILIDGRMFDVKSIKPTASGYEVTGLFDDSETVLFAQLAETENSKRDGHGVGTALFLVCLGIVGESPSLQFIPKPQVTKTAHRFEPAPVPALHKTSLDIIAPPPRPVLS